MKKNVKLIPEVSIIKCLDCNQIIEKGEDRRKLRNNVSHDCGNLNLELDYVNFKLKVNKCPNCSKPETVEISNWGDVLKEYKDNISTETKHADFKNSFMRDCCKSVFQECCSCHQGINLKKCSFCKFWFERPDFTKEGVCRYCFERNLQQEHNDPPNNNQDEEKRDKNKLDEYQSDVSVESKQPNKTEKTQNHDSDQTSLKTQQKEGRRTIATKWKNEYTKNSNYQRHLVCSDCHKNFAYDKSLIDFLSSRQKAENELKEHKKVCPLKNNEVEKKKTAQAEWDKIRKNKTRNLFSCSKCWGKVFWDKSIADAQKAWKLALADINKHEKEECGTDKKTIAIFFSPNKGGQQHADLSYATERADLILESDNQGEAYQEKEQNQENNKQQPLSLPVKILIGGGMIFFVALIGVYLLVKRKRNI